MNNGQIIWKIANAEEIKEKCRRIRYSKINPNHTEEEYQLYKTKLFIEKTRPRIITKKPIVAYIKSTNEKYKEYSSIAECAKDLNIRDEKIRQILNKRKSDGQIRHSYKGYLFKYK